MKQGWYLGASGDMHNRMQMEHVMAGRSGSRHVARALEDYGDTLEAKLEHCALLRLIDLDDLNKHHGFWPNLFGPSERTLAQVSQARV